MRNIAILAAAALFVGGAPLGWVSMAITGPLTLSTGEPAQADLATKVAKAVARDEERLVKIFKDIHANPELAFREQKTAALVAREFKELGYETHAGIGKTGVVGVLQNGPGPTVTFRGDMDALPVREATGLPWASTATAPTERGGFVPVMHACGHDAHVTFLLGVAKVMISTRGKLRSRSAMRLATSCKLGRCQRSRRRSMRSSSSSRASVCAKARRL
jgi:hypothetical protein